MGDLSIPLSIVLLRHFWYICMTPGGTIIYFIIPHSFREIWRVLSLDAEPERRLCTVA